MLHSVRTVEWTRQLASPRGLTHCAVTGCIAQVNAKRIVPEWTHYDDTVHAFEERVMAKAA